MEYFKILPVEIKLDILALTDTVLDCKLVCKPWRDLVRNSSFSKMHLHHLIHPANESGNLGFLALGACTENLYYFDYNKNHESTAPIERLRRINFTFPFKDAICFVFHACNGLICLSPTYPKPFNTPVCICNPITKEYVLLPKIKTDLDGTHGVGWEGGFGYVSSTNEYKVVILVVKDAFEEVHIYTLGSSNGWRNLRGKFEPPKTDNGFSLGVSANGILYWMNRESKMIVTFDLAEEKFGEVLALPPLPTEKSYYGCSVVLDGFFSLIIDLGVRGAEYYEIWQLKKNNNHDM